MKKKPSFSPLGEVLNQSLGKWGLAEKINLQRIQQLWPQVVGDRIAGFTQVSGLAGRRLKVKLDRADWLSALEPLQAEIIAKLNQSLGRELIEEITFETKILKKRRKQKG